MTTRRKFLTDIGHVGGFGAAYLMMQSMGLLPILAVAATKPTLAENSGAGKRVIILGGGIAGLVSAWELRKAGYTCVILEVRDRVGGRNWTVRNGTQVDFTDGSSQTCAFEHGHYFNAGPARLPSQHTTILGYCKELGVPLEVEVNSSRSSLLQCDNLNGGKPVEQRQLINDTRGHVAELLSKAIDRNALDHELTPDDKERMLEFLRTYGDLSPDYFYKGSDRSGYKTMPGAGDQTGVAKDPLDMHVLLDANLWDRMLFEETFDMQATMFQPVGGMDQIPMAFGQRLQNVIRLNCSVEQIRKTPTGVKVAYRDLKTKTINTVEGNYCICALPLTILKSIDTDFATDLKQAIASATYDSAYKIAWESRRFWEQDYSIYGGISFLRQTVNVVWYPSAKLFSEKGIIIGGYSVESGTPFETMSTAAKLDASRQAIEVLHPGCSKELSKPVYVSWGRIPHNLGSWVHFGRPTPNPEYERLLQPDGPIYLAGDHTAHVGAWQEGAALSAHRVVNLIDQSVSAASARS